MKKPYYTLPWELRFKHHKLHDNQDTLLKCFENRLMRGYRRINEPGVYHINECKFNRHLTQDSFLDDEFLDILKDTLLVSLDD